MKALSIWNPYALLLVKGFKHFETRSWPAPRSIIGKRIAIAATASIRPEARALFEGEDFQRCYERLGLPMNLLELPKAAVLGTVVLDSVEPMTPEFMDDVSNEEKTYGYWEEGLYAWRVTDPTCFEVPIPVRGAQGFWEWSPSSALKDPVVIPAAERFAVG